MVIAVSLVHTNDLATLNQGGGWTLELQGFYFFGALCIMFLGAGRYSIDALLRRRDNELPPPDAK
jgi:putative oxidoreductase